MMKTHSQRLVTDTSSNVTVQKAHICPICRDEVSFTFSSAGFGHICKTNSKMSESGDLISNINRGDVCSSKNVKEGTTKCKDYLGSSLPDPNPTSRKNMNENASVLASKKSPESEEQNLTASAGDSELNEKRENMSKDEMGEPVNTASEMPDKVSYDNFLKVLPFPIQRNISKPQIVDNTMDQEVSKITTSLYLSGHNYATKESKDESLTKTVCYKCSVCDKTFSKSHLLSYHMLKHKRTKSHVCDVCAKAFLRKSDLKKHMHTHNGVKPFKCVHCEKTFARNSALKRHLICLHNMEKNGKVKNKTDGGSCSLKSVDSNLENKLKNYQHVSSEESNDDMEDKDDHMTKEKRESSKLSMEKSEKEKELHSCQVCDEVFGELITLERHLLHEHYNLIKKHECLICQKRFSSNHKLKEHKLSHAGDEKHTCKVCQKKFFTAQNLKRHFKRHTGEMPFGCKLCGAKFYAAKFKEEHMNAHTGARPYVCEHCGKGFGRSSNYDRHIRIHGDGKQNKLHSCKICGKKLQSIQSLREHINSHTGAKPYKCPTCGRTFGRISCRDRHMKLHSRIKPHTCEFCSKKFRSKSYLSMHRRIHTGEKPFKCTLCERTFTMVANCRLHIKRHSKEKRYKCSYCEKAFTAPFTLNEHLRVHTGEKPFQCLYCPDAFSTQVLWRSHIYNHTGEMAYQCNICGKCFIHGPSLNKHLKKNGHSGGRNPNVLTYAECVQQGKIKPTRQNKDASLEVENAVTNLTPVIDSETTHVTSTPAYQMIQIISPTKQHDYTNVQREVVITSCDPHEPASANSAPHSQNHVVALTQDDIVIEESVDTISHCEEDVVTLDTLAGVACKDQQISANANFDHSQNIDKKDLNNDSNHSVSVTTILPNVENHDIVDKTDSKETFNVNVVHLGNDKWCLTDENKALHVCDICKKGFVFESRFQSHFCTAKDENVDYECVDCTKTFIEKILLQLHMLAHKQEISKSENLI